MLRSSVKPTKRRLRSMPNRMARSPKRCRVMVLASAFDEALLVTPTPFVVVPALFGPAGFA